MIQFNDRFKFDRDAHGWTLVETRDGVSTKAGSRGEPVQTDHNTYYSCLEHVLNAILDRSAGHAETLCELKEVIHRTREEVRDVLRVGVR